MKTKIFLIVLIILTINSYAVEMIEEAPLSYIGPRSASLGGFHAADATGIERIFNNPAGIAHPEDSLLVFESTLGLKGPVFDIASMVIAGMGSGVDFTSNPDFFNLLTRINAGAKIFGPLSLAYAGKGISFGVFHWANLDFKSQSLSLASEILDTLMVTGGLGGRIFLAPEHFLDIGGNIKAYFRGAFSFTKSILEVLSLINSNPFSMLTSSEFVFSVGTGIDFGLLYSWSDLLSVGLVARDISASYRKTYPTLNSFLGTDSSKPSDGAGYAPINLAGGVKYSPKIPILKRYIGETNFYLDYNDILGFLTHPETNKFWLLNMNIGLEMTFLDVLSVRGGFSQGLVTAGIGLDLTVIKIDVAAFGSEESTMPGFNPVYNLALGFKVTL